MLGFVLDPDTRERLAAKVSFMLRALREAEKIGSNGFESTSWRGQLSGFSSALEITLGVQVTNEILDIVREEACKDLGERAGSRLMERAFPQVEREPVDSLGYEYVALGQHEKALAEGLRAFEKNPDSSRRYAFLIRCYILLNRLEEAQALVEEASRKQIDSPSLHFCSYLLAFLKRDIVEMETQVTWGMGKPGIEDVMLSLEAGTQAFFGRLSAARDFSSRAVRSAEQFLENELAARYQVDAAVREALFGNVAEARQQAESALGHSACRDVKYRVALALGFAGDAASTTSLVDDGESSLPEAIVQFNYRPTLDGQLALSRNDPVKAIEALEAAAPYELGTAGKAVFYPVYVRGEAFLLLRQARQAAAEFQKILDYPGIALSSPISIRARLGQARAHAMQGDILNAKSAYQDFFTLWKDADSEIPILKQAQAEYTNLQ